MKESKVSCLVNMKYLLFFLSFLPALTNATVFNSQTDFSSTINPNDPWSYESVVIGAANNTSTVMGHGNYPSGWHNGADSPYTVVLPTLFHPGIGADTLIVFTAQTTGLHGVNLNIVDADQTVTDRDDGVVFSVWKNDNLIDTLILSDIYVPIAKSYDVNMSIGDRLNFRLNRNGAYWYDSTGHDITINDHISVPEPTTLLLMGLGLAGLRFRRRRLATCFTGLTENSESR